MFTGDITPLTSNVEMVYVVLLLVPLLCSWMLMLAQITMNIEIANAPANEFSSTERMFQQLAGSIQLPDPLVRDVVTWRKNLWRRQRGYMANSGDILLELPPALRVEVLWSSCIDSLLQVPQLAGLTSGGVWRRQLGLVTSLLSSLKLRFCVPGEAVFVNGQVVTSYFLLTEGTVELQSGHKTVQARCLISTEAEIHSDDCTTMTFCTIQCLEKRVLGELMSQYPAPERQLLQQQEYEIKQDPSGLDPTLVSVNNDTSLQENTAAWYWIESGGRAESLWIMMRCASHFYFAVIVPLRIGFALNSNSFAAFGQWSLVIDAFCDVLAWTEMFVLRRYCFTSIDDATGSVIPPRDLWRQYTSSLFGLALDLLTVCPLDYVCLLHSFELLFWARLLRLLPMWNFSSVYDTLLDKLEALFMPLPRSALAIFKQLLLMWLFSSAMSFDVVLRGALGEQRHQLDESRPQVHNLGFHMWSLPSSGICPSAESGPEFHLLHLYVISNYFVFTIMSTVGYGDITPGTTLETALVCFIMFYGCYLFGGVTGSLASVVSNVDTTAELHSGRSKQLLVFAENRRLPESLSRRLEAYMQELWSQYLGTSPNLTLKSLPASLNQRVAWHRFGATLSNLPLFRGCAELPEGLAMIQELGSVIESRLFAAPTVVSLSRVATVELESGEAPFVSDNQEIDPNYDYLAVCGRYNDAMFVLVDGSAEVLPGHSDGKTLPVVDTSPLTSGRLEANAAAGRLAWFGERNVMAGVPQLMKMSIRAAERCEALVLRHVAVCRAVQKHTCCRLCSTKQSQQSSLVKVMQDNFARQSDKSSPDTLVKAFTDEADEETDKVKTQLSAKLVQPEVGWRHWWELASLWLLVWYALMVPAMAVFTGTSSYTQYWLLMSASYAVDLFFWLDIYYRLRCFVPIDSSDQLLASDPQSLTQLMMKKYPLQLSLDVLACAPIDLVALLAWAVQGTARSSNVASWLALYRLNKLFLMHRLPAQWARVAWYVPLHASDPLPFMFGFTENRYCKQLLKFLIVLDWIAITWFFIGMNHIEFAVLSWAKLNSLVADALPTGRYVWSVYWSVVTASTVGYGDITPQNIGEIIFWFGAMLIGQILFADIIGSISIQQSAVHSTAFGELDDIEQLKAGLRHMRAPLRLRRQIVRQLRHSAERQDCPPLQVAAQLPMSLLAEIKSNVNSLFFSCVPHLAGLASGPCGAALAALLRRVKYSRGEVVESADTAKRISVLVRGKLWKGTDLAAAASCWYFISLMNGCAGRASGSNTC